jgi:hypothetical protein
MLHITKYYANDNLIETTLEGVFSCGFACHITFSYIYLKKNIHIIEIIEACIIMKNCIVFIINLLINHTDPSIKYKRCVTYCYMVEKEIWL